MYRQAKHKASKIVLTAKCKFYTERIALASSSEELHQIVSTLSNRHPPKILSTIYPSADLPSIFNKHFTSKVEKLRANIASEHVTSTLVTGATAATFLHHHMSLTCCIKSHCTPATLAPAHTPCIISIDLHAIRQHLVIVYFLLLLLQ